MTEALNRNPSTVNFGLAGSLAYRSLKRHRVVALATIIGVALGMLVVATILIVDFNTARPKANQIRLNQEIHQDLGNKSEDPVMITRVSVIDKQDSPQTLDRSIKPSADRSQTLEANIDVNEKSDIAGEQDYQTMRLAIRLASLLAFFIGAVIVFYTMRFSVASRSREFCLLQCVGEYRLNIALSLTVEALLLGTAGVTFGLLFAFPAAYAMLQAGISTTGRLPLSGFTIPIGELSVLALAGITIALLGVAGPVHNLYKMNIADELHPRYSSSNIDHRDFSVDGIGWMFPPLILVCYLAIRPFLLSWISVVYLFIFEACFAIVLTGAILWWTTPVLKFVIRISESLFGLLFPLETMLTGRRMRLMSRKITFSVTSVILVFSLLAGLHSIIRALKYEINRWSAVALVPYEYFRAPKNATLPDAEFFNSARNAGIYFFRLSEKIDGTLPLRLIHSQDINRYRQDQGLPPMGANSVIFSKTLAARFGVEPGDYLRIDTTERPYYFEILDVSDDVGFFFKLGQYIDQKSFALFSDKNPLFNDRVGLSPGQLLMAKNAENADEFLSQSQWELLRSRYIYIESGRYAVALRIGEIDKDFLIFDFVLVMTILLAIIGVVNAMLIQVQTRSREFAVFMSLGMSRGQIVRLLLVEGLIIGLVGAVLATALGALLGFISVSFLNQFTVFEYRFVWSLLDTAVISISAIVCCCVAAIYPAFIATQSCNAESLHYE